MNATYSKYTHVNVTPYFLADVTATSVALQSTYCSVPYAVHVKGIVVRPLTH